MRPIHKYTIRKIQQEYKKSKSSWILGFSGGKDSTALLKLVYLALRGLRKRDKKVIVFYCDTGVEIPVVRKYVYKALKKICKEASLDKIPITTKIVQPCINDRYFVNMIGKGYPPPTNKFRWCTDRLRVNPTKLLYEHNSAKKNIILLGIRKGESPERDKIIQKHKTRTSYYFRHSHNSNSIIYSPMLRYNTNDVWDLLLSNHRPKSIDAKKLMRLYNWEGTDRTQIKQRRFGCWVCTVVRKDRAMEGLIKEGVAKLKPLLDYRNWLMQIRDNTSYRYKKRRNGTDGLGPFTLSVRRKILDRLLETQRNVPWKLITKREIELIRKIWKVERRNQP